MERTSTETEGEPPLPSAAIAHRYLRGSRPADAPLSSRDTPTSPTVDSECLADTLGLSRGRGFVYRISKSRCSLTLWPTKWTLLLLSVTALAVGAEVSLRCLTASATMVVAGSSVLLLLSAAAAASEPRRGAPPATQCPAPGTPPQPCDGAQGSYRNLADSNASACCKACYDDAQTPCAGWILQPAEKNAQPICHLKLGARFIVPSPEGNTHCGLVRNITGPPAPPAPPPSPPPPPLYPIKPAPPGAKNVLFIISDGA